MENLGLQQTEKPKGQRLLFFPPRTKPVVAAGRRTGSARLGRPALEDLQPQERTRWEIAWMSDVR